MFIWRDSGETWSRAVCHSSMLYAVKLTRCLDGLTKLFTEIKEKGKIADLSLEYQKFAEWLRIELVR